MKYIELVVAGLTDVFTYQEGLIFDHSDRLVEEALTTMLVPPHEKRDDLKRLYTLVACVCYCDGDKWGYLCDFTFFIFFVVLCGWCDSY